LLPLTTGSYLAVQFSSLEGLSTVIHICLQSARCITVTKISSGTTQAKAVTGRAFQVNDAVFSASYRCHRHKHKTGRPELPLIYD